MNHSPLKTALAYECFPNQDNSTLALPSDQKMQTGTSGKQRVQEQVMMTVRRQKSKSSQSSTLTHSNRGTGSCARAPARGGSACAPGGGRDGAHGPGGCRGPGSVVEAGVKPGANPEPPPACPDDGAGKGRG